MKVLVVGSGGREHVIVWKLMQNLKVEKIFVAPGNAGTAQIAENIDIESTDIKGLLAFARREKIDFTFVGPEAPLVAGIVDVFEKAGLNVFGPQKKAAQLEGSKVFAKNIMKKNRIPTADYEVFSDPEQAIAYIEKIGGPIVVKADGLAAGKGVTVAKDREEAIVAVKEAMIDKKYGQAGEKVVIEECLQGEEATVMAFTDGKTVVPMVPSQDHKPAYDGGKGPNTGGMGAYAPAPVIEKGLLEDVKDNILVPIVKGLQDEGIDYKGVIYCGLMIDNDSVNVLEFNVRFGDPETQVVLPLLKNNLLTIAEAIREEKLSKIDIEWFEERMVCVIMASGGYPVKYEKGKEITGLNKVKDTEGVTVFHAGTEKKDDKLLTAGGRVLGVTAIGNNFENTIDKAYKSVEDIKFTDAHYRKDIGQKALNR